MNCPFCELTGTRREVHSHLVDGHADEVGTTTSTLGRRFYELACPLCEESYRAEIKPRHRDPGFVAEYWREIRLVAFDMLLHHLRAAHEEVSHA